MRYIAVLLSIAGILTINIVYATKHKQIYQSHEGYAKSVTDNRMQQSGFTAQKGSNFNDHYTENPNESSYGNAPEQMTAQASNAIEQSAYATATRDGFNENPPFKINPNDPVYAESKFYMQHAKNISHGTSDRYIDCNAHRKCRTVMVPHTCEKSQTASLACHKVATAHTKKVPYQTQVNYSGNLIKYGQYSYGLKVPEPGTIKSFSVRFWHEGHNSFFCHTTYNGYINGKHFSSYRKNDCYHLFYFLPFAAQNLNVAAQVDTPVKITFGGGGLDEWLNRYPYTITMQVTRYKNESYITWSEVIC